MKEITDAKITVAAIPISELVIGGVYWNSKNEICKIIDVDNEKRQVKLLNMNEQMTVYLDFKRCVMTKRIR